MKAYQEAYLQNLRRISELSDGPDPVFRDTATFLDSRRQRSALIRQVVRENTAMLHQEFFPLLDNISSATPEQVRELEEFASRLWSGGAHLDLLLSYSIHTALLTYARRQMDRDMLIRELYYTGMTLFYMQERINYTGQSRYQWKMGLMFGEAASYIKHYDQIEAPETRGFIHRAMANLALAYNGATLEDGQRKLAAIRRSLHILEDPVYQAKTPSLPWDTFIYKSHQERATALSVLRTGVSDPQLLREVMESAEYIRERQLESARQQNIKPLTRWQMVYEAMQYHCGIRPLSDFLHWLESAYLERDETDRSEDGLYRNVFLPALYADYLSRHPEYKARKKEVLCYMYRQLAEYVRHFPLDQADKSLQRYLISCLWSFVEYPDGIQLKDFLKLVLCRDPDTYALSATVAQITRRMAQLALEEQPKLLLGLLGCQSVQQLRAREEAVLQFAWESGRLHNVGLLVFSPMLRRSGREWLEEEQEMLRYHVYAGEIILTRSDSTRPYASAALNHHCSFNGQGGYPPGHDRTADPDQAVTDLISAAALLVRLTDDITCYSREALPLSQALDRVRRESGLSLSPAAASLLLELSNELPDMLEEGKAHAYEEAFRLLSG